jgi:hypothetical protein
MQVFEADPEAGEDVLLSELLKQAGASLKWGPLEPALFPNGPLFFEERLPQVRRASLAGQCPVSPKGLLCDRTWINASLWQWRL